MNNFIFQNSTKVYFGKGCVKEYLTCLTKNAQTILLAYGGGSIKRNGVYDEITGILKETGKNIVEFSGIMSNPTYAKVQEGARLARDNQADMILAVGGGSTMLMNETLLDISRQFWKAIQQIHQQCGTINKATEFVRPLKLA